MQDLTRRLASCCEAIGTADESKRVSDIFSGGDNQGDATDSLFVSILRAGCVSWDAPTIFRFKL